MARRYYQRRPGHGPARLQAPRPGPNQQVRFDPRRGYWIGPRVTYGTQRPPPGAAPAAPIDPQLAAATKIAAATVDPQVAEITRAIAAREQQERARAEGAKGVMGALGTFGAGMPEAVRQAYQTAADRTVGYSEGITGEAGAASQRAAQEAAGMIASLGAPGEVTSEAPAYQNVARYLGGVLPGGDLAREAASRMAETSALRYAGGATLAQEALQQANASRQETEELRARGVDIERTRPGEVQKALAQLRAESREERGVRIQERALQVQIGQLQLQQAQTKQETAIALTNLTGTLHVVRNGKVVNTGKVAQGSEAFTSAVAEQGKTVRATQAEAGRNRRARLERQRLAAQEKIDSGLEQARFNLSEKQYQLAVQKEARMARGTAAGGFSNTQKQKFRGTTLTIAAALEKEKDKTGKDIPKTASGFPRPQDVIKYAMTQGVPFSIALSVVRNLARTRFKGDEAWQVAAATWGA